MGKQLEEAILSTVSHFVDNAEACDYPDGISSRIAKDIKEEVNVLLEQFLISRDFHEKIVDLLNPFI